MRSLPTAQPAASEDDLEPLLARARTGDFDAFQQIVLRLQPRIFTFARRLTGNDADAEDVTQQTFLALLEHLDQYRGEAPLISWLLRIAANEVHRLWRQRRRQIEPEHSDDDDSAAPLARPEFIAPWRDDPQQLVLQQESRMLIEQALAELPEKYRIVFVLRDIEGFSTEQTAEILGISVPNVKVRLLRARLMLRERLTHYFGDPQRRVVPDHDHG
ncbi:MAG: sigma-70 family RNA polymerase sigma factor [Gemmatales bacterium]|nr:sigma-70 family RNA polymerase sigma factor [Gemmatales bacterium]